MSAGAGRLCTAFLALAFGTYGNTIFGRLGVRISCCALVAVALVLLFTGNRCMKGAGGGSAGGAAAVEFREGVAKRFVLGGFM